MNDDKQTPQLSAIEARILGCLIEKEATTPDAYPLTVNNVVLACNQKTAREPVLALETGEVHHALRQLELRGLVRSQHTARAERYAHRFEIVFDLTPPQTALMALLMLRGPQTVHELYARSERLARIESAEQTAFILQRLMQREIPLVAVLPRRPGQREDRYRQLLVEADEAALLMEESLADVTGSAPPLRQRLEDLERRVAALEQLLAARGDGAGEAPMEASVDAGDGAESRQTSEPGMA